MKTKKCIGIYMDHSMAHLMELENDLIVSTYLGSQPELLSEQQIVYKDESHSLNKEQSQLSAYYKKIGDVILKYDNVLLFGPTDAKNELLNVLKKDHLFDQIKIVVKTVDKLNENHQNTFVNDFFNSSVKSPEVRNNEQRKN